MKKFDFKLEPLYKLRRNIEKRKQAELAEESAKYNREREAKDNCIFKINDGIRIVDSIEDADEMMNMTFYFGDYVKALNSQIALHEENMSVIEIELSKRREKLKEAAKDRRAVELLKEKKFLEYKKLMHKEEQAKLDEWKKEY